MNTDKTAIDAIRDSLIPLFIEYGITKSAVFGSFARGEETDSSDVDLLFSINNHMPLSEWNKMEERIQTALGRPVDFIEYGTFPKRLETEILKEAVLLYEQP
ncbi:MAG: nucleotidyltransferase domain-containing protein [Oscillospiraceae bacterium]|jgi:predicted nucleotidyltransferase|nr:nucleotidyltransferase domain-containing protein [Oscillospiraceae bacterium]